MSRARSRRTFPLFFGFVVWGAVSGWCCCQCGGGPMGSGGRSLPLGLEGSDGAGVDPGTSRNLQKPGGRSGPSSKMGSFFAGWLAASFSSAFLSGDADLLTFWLGRIGSLLLLLRLLLRLRIFLFLFLPRDLSFPLLSFFALASPASFGLVSSGSAWASFSS